ncbi:uncharacterized protein LOC128559063 [Mercenaria mercenaria]|uniref:uncharacterized protein LOC128559063 n=1 Tax=Mercenaria mercenaria TaxID=6596 RepID=UPI00234F1370|nr:uncharacterized protein LOC128559063 [Mercenaria mercenaria]
MTWWNSQRSTYDRLTQSVSGQGAKRLTPHEERLQERLTFLSGHVYRVPKRAGVNLMQRLREKHPDRFNEPASQDMQQRDSDTDSEHEQTTPTVTQTEENVRNCNQTAVSSTSRKQKLSHLLLEKIEKRMAANQQQMSQIIQQEDNPRAAFGRMVGLSAAQMDDEAFEGLQLDVTNLLVKYKRESRARAQAAL